MSDLLSENSIRMEIISEFSRSNIIHRWMIFDDCAFFFNDIRLLRWSHQRPLKSINLKFRIHLGTWIRFLNWCNRCQKLHLSPKFLFCHLFLLLCFVNSSLVFSQFLCFSVSCFLIFFLISLRKKIWALIGSWHHRSSASLSTDQFVWWMTFDRENSLIIAAIGRIANHVKSSNITMHRG